MLSLLFPSFRVLKKRSSLEASKSQVVTDAGNVEQSRATIVAAVDQLPDNVASFKTEYAAKSKRRLKDVTKSITSTNDVVDDVNTQVREKGLFAPASLFSFAVSFFFSRFLFFFGFSFFSVFSSLSFSSSFWQRPAAPKGAMSYRIGGFCPVCLSVCPSVCLSVRPPRF